MKGISQEDLYAHQTDSSARRGNTVSDSWTVCMERLSVLGVQRGLEQMKWSVAQPALGHTVP